MARTWRSWKPGTPLARMPNGAAAAETDRRSLQKCKAELRREPAVPFGVFVPENQTRDFRETPASRVRCSTVSGSPDADDTTRTLLRDGRARKTESVPAVGRRAFATWATWAKLLDARWALPSARRGAGDPAPNERGQTLPSRATQPRAEAERKRAETHAVSGNITGGDERRTGDVTEDTRLARQPRVGRSGRRDTQTVDCVTGSGERACPRRLALGVGSARGGRGGQSDATSVRPAAPWGHRPPPSSRWLVLALPAVLRAGGALADAWGRRRRRPCQNRILGQPA